MSFLRSPSIERPPARTGVGLKPEYYRLVIETQPDVGFFEVHAENYMVAGGPPHRYLSAICEIYPLSLHGVGLSIGADRPLDQDHIRRLRRLIDRYTPALFSEHLAWSSHETGFLNDLLPLPYTKEDAGSRRRSHRRGSERLASPDASGEPFHLSCIQ